MVKVKNNHVSIRYLWQVPFDKNAPNMCHACIQQALSEIVLFFNGNSVLLIHLLRDNEQKQWLRQKSICSVNQSFVNGYFINENLLFLSIQTMFQCITFFRLNSPALA
jgi:hypothetical protein